MGLALLPEPRPKAQRPPTRFAREARSLGEQSSTRRARTLSCGRFPAAICCQHQGSG